MIKSPNGVEKTEVLKSLLKFLDKKKIVNTGLFESSDNLMSKSRYYTLDKFPLHANLNITFPYLSKYLTEKIHER